MFFNQQLIYIHMILYICTYTLGYRDMEIYIIYAYMYIYIYPHISIFVYAYIHTDRRTDMGFPALHSS